MSIPTARLLCAFAILLVGRSQVASAQTRALALVGGTINADPSATPIRNGVLVVQDGTITAIGARGAVRVPGGAQIIEELAAQLQAMLTRYGFTSVFDTGRCGRTRGASAIGSSPARLQGRASAPPARS
jgi:hypothetical protein